MLTGKYSINRISVYEHKLHMLHNLTLKNSIFLRNSLLQLPISCMFSSTLALCFIFKYIKKCIEFIMLHKSIYKE
jgi:hypothetical protein